MLQTRGITFVQQQSHDFARLGTVADQRHDARFHAQRNGADLPTGTTATTGRRRLRQSGQRTPSANLGRRIFDFLEDLTLAGYHIALAILQVADALHLTAVHGIDRANTVW